jgi:hypothetical protein
MRDMISNQTILRGAPQTLSGVTANNSALIDRRGYSSVTVYLATDAVTDAGTSAGFTMKLQHSDTTVGTDFVDVPAAGLVAGLSGSTTVTVTLDTADNVIAGGVGYVAGKRYVRGVVTGTTGTDAIVNVLAVLGKPSQAPATIVGATTAAT